MAKKKVVEKPVTEVGRIEIILNIDGTYGVETTLQPDYITLYANLLKEIAQGTVNEIIIQNFAASEDVINQQVGLYLSTWLKSLKNQNQPLIAPDKVFRKKVK